MKTEGAAANDATIGVAGLGAIFFGDTGEVDLVFEHHAALSLVATLMSSASIFAIWPSISVTIAA